MCKLSIYVGHNFSIKDQLDKDYPKKDPTKLRWPIPPGDCVIGVGCGANRDVDGDGKPDSLQDLLERFNACNTVFAPDLNKLDDPVDGLKAIHACRMARYAFDRAKSAARKLCKGECPNPKRCKKWKDPSCDEVEIEVKCDAAARKLFEEGIWTDVNGDEIRVPGTHRRACAKLCGRKMKRKCK